MTDRNDLSEKKTKSSSCWPQHLFPTSPQKTACLTQDSSSTGFSWADHPAGPCAELKPVRWPLKKRCFSEHEDIFSEKAIWDLIKPWGHWWSLKRSWENHGFPPWDQGTERYLSASRAAMAPEPAEVMAWWWNEPPTERDDRGDTMTWLKYPLVNGILWWFNGILWDLMGFYHLVIAITLW